LFFGIQAKKNLLGTKKIGVTIYRHPLKYLISIMVDKFSFTDLPAGRRVPHKAAANLFSVKSSYRQYGTKDATGLRNDELYCSNRILTTCLTLFYM